MLSEGVLRRVIALAGLVSLVATDVQSWSMASSRSWRLQTSTKGSIQLSATSVPPEDSPINVEQEGFSQRIVTPVSLSRREMGSALLSRTLGPVAVASASAFLVGTETHTWEDGTWSLVPPSSNALVKGVAPPPSSKKAPPSGPRKCRNVEECQAQAEQKEQEEREEAMKNQTPALVTAGGTRYRDIEVPSSPTAVVKDGDDVKLYYKVLKLGKRSYDGLSGEGTVVFSRGYGLEDDEKEPGTKYFSTTVGSYSNIAALNDALVGMPVGATRRFAILPQKGWRKPDRACDGGPGGSGAGGDIKTDMVVVPTAQLVAEEACFDATKRPFPETYAQQRRMAQRFDQSLIMEVQVVEAGPSTSGL